MRYLQHVTIVSLCFLAPLSCTIYQTPEEFVAAENQKNISETAGRAALDGNWKKAATILQAAIQAWTDPSQSKELESACSGLLGSLYIGDIPHDNQHLFDNCPKKWKTLVLLNPDREVLPIVRIEPVYSRGAIAKGIRGFVEIIFDVTQDGNTTNIRVLKSSNPIFNRDSIVSVRRWKYLPKLVDGQPTQSFDLVTRALCERYKA